MNPVAITGLGAVSPAGWGVPSLIQAIHSQQPLPTSSLEHPGCPHSLKVRAVPPPSPKPGFLAHPRLRRASAISHYAVAAALEALGPHRPDSSPDPSRLGIIFCTMCGGVRYTRRFVAETQQNPATASPLVFPETVFNAPASHLASVLGCHGLVTSLIGDQGVFLLGLATAADWLLQHQVDQCLVVAAEETDWTAAHAWKYFTRDSITSEGAGALLLERTLPRPATHPILATLERITSPQLFLGPNPAAALAAVRRELPDPIPAELLASSRTGSPVLDHAELAAFHPWPGPELCPKLLLGEGVTAATAWQCVAAIHALQSQQAPAATVLATGCNQQAIAARFLPG